MLATRMRMSAGRKFYTYKINHSCRFNDDDSAYLHWTPAGAGTEETFTFSTWIKRCNLGSIMQIFNAAAGNEIQFTAADKLQFTTATATLLTTQLFRDVGSHLHIVLGVDTTQATAANRVGIEINGVAISDFDTETYPNLNEVTEFGKASIHHISSNEVGTEEFDGYQTEVIYIDGLKVAASNFGKSKYGIWIPKRYTGSYGTNGFKLDFADSSDLGKDVSGNGNDFTSSGLTSDDQAEDSPTNNYSTLNIIDKSLTGAVLSNGNLKLTLNTGSRDGSRATYAIPSSGKWYFEMTGNNNSCYGGIANQDETLDNALPSADVDTCAYLDNGTPVYVESVVKAGYWSAAPAGNPVGVCVDMDNLKISWQNAAEGQGAEYSFGATTGDTWFPFGCGNNVNMSFNFGQLEFAHTPPTGYKALCSKNLPTPTIKNSSIGFDVIAYEGNATVRDITDLNFDISTGGLVWIKNRDAADEHKLIDTVRGTTKELSSNSNVVEGTDTNGLTAFLTNGFSLGTGAAGYNDNAESFVAWCFRMGAKYGFDIITDTGTGVAHVINHNLGGVPELIIRKSTDGVYNWAVYHHHALNKTDPETDYGLLDLSIPWDDNIIIWNDTAPTSTQFTVGTGTTVNANGKNFINYLWRSIEGFSKIFSYKGNGNVDGPFIYCGFRPAYLLIKNVEYDPSSWVLFDVKRDTYNVVNHWLTAESIFVEGITAGIDIDILSNGFKVRGTNHQVNYNGSVIVGIAYAEQPGKWSNAR